MKKTFFILTILLTVAVMSGFANGSTAPYPVGAGIHASAEPMNVANDFMLLALDDTTGKFITSKSRIYYGMAGSMLFELAEMGRITFMNKKVVLKNQDPTGNPMLDELLDLIKAKKKSKSVVYWIKKAGKKAKKFKSPLLEQMADKGFLRKESAKKYTAAQSSAHRESQLREAIRGVLFDQKAPDSLERLFVGLVYSCKLHKGVFTNKAEYKSVKRRLKEIGKADVIAKAIRKVIRSKGDADFLLLLYAIN
ncbi:MAG: GPP34 family phosphoprotein [bacterium]|nr:GPP34 family phosphoprotein [bacterium]